MVEIGDSVSVSGEEFEKIISTFVTRMGFTVESSERLMDGSVEFVAKTTNPMGGKVTSLIRASPYSRPVVKEDVQSLYESMLKHNAVRAAYITTSEFSPDAEEASRELPLSLINKFHITDSLGSRGYGMDKEFTSSLEKFGLAEKYFQGVEQAFVPSRSPEDAKKYFESKGKKKNFLGNVVSADIPIHIRLRYAPVGVFKFVSVKDVWTGSQELRKVERRDHLFLNLSSLDLYYIMQMRKKNITETTLNVSDVIKKINSLPEDSKTFLMYLMQHGDLLTEDLESVDLTILKNKKVIQTYEGDKPKVAKDWTDMAEQMLEGLLDTVYVVIDELVSGLSSMGEGAKKDEDKPKKKVEAYVVMPDTYEGIYDLWGFMEAERGRKIDSDVDSIAYSSGSQVPLLSAILKASVSCEGIIFLPYYRAKYMNPASKKITKYEILFAPKFKKSAVKEEAVDKKGKSVGPRITGRKDFAQQPYRVIR
ncbi:MAG: restriction endonuclease [Candidatus Altiarchaeota archaeon]|nr:restriction endonuclease [Candidatus Altiarchaeota archaeon]